MSSSVEALKEVLNPNHSDCLESIKTVERLVERPGEEQADWGESVIKLSQLWYDEVRKTLTFDRGSATFAEVVPRSLRSQLEEHINGKTFRPSSEVRGCRFLRKLQ